MIAGLLLWVAVAAAVPAPHPPLADDTTCAACHDPGKADPAHGGLLSEGSRCAACHLDATAPHFLGLSVHAPLRAGGCGACHVVPGGRLVARGSWLCLSCHSEETLMAADAGVAADAATGPGAAGSVHAALWDGPKGRAGCLSCHDPHVARLPDLLTKGPVERCEACHAAYTKAGKDEPGCALARERCEVCHAPHAAGRKALVSVDQHQLCAECHDLAGKALARTHLGADLRRLDCQRCHSSHGDGRPKLLARSVHPALMDGCEACHEDGSARKLVAGGGTDLCTACHDGVVAAARAQPVVHGAMELDACRSCHDPHASPRLRLTREPAVACGGCHPREVAGEGEVAHGVIELLGCEVCHEPHGGAGKALLRKAPPELCLECHLEGPVRAARGGPRTVLERFTLPPAALDTLRVLRLDASGRRGHPTLAHLTLGTPTAAERVTTTSFRGELSCLSCHDPHKGKGRTLLLGGVADGASACRRCHAR